MILKLKRLPINEIVFIAIYLFSNSTIAAENIIEKTKNNSFKNKISFEMEIETKVSAGTLKAGQKKEVITETRLSPGYNLSQNLLIAMDIEFETKYIKSQINDKKSKKSKKNVPEKNNEIEFRGLSLLGMYFQTNEWTKANYKLELGLPHKNIAGSVSPSIMLTSRNSIMSLLKPFYQTSLRRNYYKQFDYKSGKPNYTFKYENTVGLDFHLLEWLDFGLLGKVVHRWCEKKKRKDELCVGESLAFNISKNVVLEIGHKYWGPLNTGVKLYDVNGKELDPQYYENGILQILGTSAYITDIELEDTD